MIRLLAVSTAALLLVAGCGKTETPVYADCDYEDLDLSMCDTSTLGVLQAEGIWNMNLTFVEGDTAPASIRFSGEPRIAGLPITEKSAEPNRFLLTSDGLLEDGVTPRRFLFAGCSAASPTQVQGKFRRCTGGRKDLEGSFEAARVQRRAGEAEGSGVAFVSETALPNGQARDVVVAGGYAYVAAREAGLYIYDVTNPRQPALVKSLELSPSDNDAWHQVLVRDQTLYIASSLRGVIFYDLTNPRDPVSPKSLPVARDADVRALAIDGNWLYAASPTPNAEVLIFDVTNPREPVQAKRYFVEQSIPDRGDLPWDLKVHNGRLYVSHGFYGLTVSDVTNPRQPMLLGRYSVEGAESRTAVVGTLGNRTLAFEAGEGWGTALRVLNVSSPELITKGGELKLRPEVPLGALSLVGTKLYAANYQDGVRILNVTQAETLEPLGYFNTWRETDAYRGSSFFEGASDVEVPGDGYIYVAETSRGLVVLRE